MEPNNRQQSEFVETVIKINRISKKTKGGNQIRFSALVVVGDKKGKVGVGLGKAPNVVSGIRKAISQARKNMITVPMRGTTIPYEVRIKYGAAKLLLKPAPSGSGVVAGGPLRAVFESAGVHDVVAKILGSNNKTTNLYAVIRALQQLSDWRETQEARNANRKGTKSVNA
ncbi:MAG: 30S ribosomal protein S5 [Candidatus Blackburnbacteria bacterium RIFCSPHIGHO2_01_FULL_43_15b]|uniref:Small ribosomal subunit protein uS5 n=1 Tax=Candidatus Blackburnbacteria bacterium RIFCSPHIGHO2_01_FULL_43_15b TaxID=1797513 RepID=A0A1G1UZ10_9BACT|nr:MAG: 30S ribosomal protein S5 [Candidatus Blackburnbacteria bacterium RIFCSPHIGHO2_01_FULL_43_15b]